MGTTTAEKVGVTVGTVFRNLWGYDQTNIDYYEVRKVSASGKTLTLQPIKSGMVRAGGASGNKVAPLPGVNKTRRTGEWVREDDGTHRFEPGPDVDEPTITKRVQITERGDPYVMMKYGWCNVWDGAPDTETDILSGH